MLLGLLTINTRGAGVYPCRCANSVQWLCAQYVKARERAQTRNSAGGFDHLGLCTVVLGTAFSMNATFAVYDLMTCSLFQQWKRFLLVFTLGFACPNSDTTKPNPTAQHSAVASQKSFWVLQL